MIKKIVHIGYPKNFSTSLQYDFFFNHPQLFHMGIGPNLKYHDRLVDVAFEVYLKSTKGFMYAEVENRIQAHFTNLFRLAQENGKDVVTVSSEHLSFAFSYDSLGFEEKIRRLARLMRDDTGILAIIRDQFSLIKSLYRESVRVGFPGDFSYYTYLLYKYQDRNFYYDLRYDLVYGVLLKYFNPKNIHFIFFEDMRDANEKLINVNGEIKLIRSVCDVLGVNYMETDFGHYNEALDDSTVTAKAELNKTTRHDFGNIQLETVEKHRMKNYLVDELKLREEESAIYSDVIIKRALIKEAQRNKLDKNKKISYVIDSEIEYRMKQFYEEGNHNFAASTNLILPNAYLNLNF